MMLCRGTGYYLGTGVGDEHSIWDIVLGHLADTVKMCKGITLAEKCRPNVNFEIINEKTDSEVQ